MYTSTAIYGRPFMAVQSVLQAKDWPKQLRVEALLSETAAVHIALWKEYGREQGCVFVLQGTQG